MPTEPPEKRAVVFVDGQNLFHGVREAFGYTYPNYDVAALAGRLCRGHGWTLVRTRFSVTPENYRRVTDYRNPILAEAMKVLGYVERFGVGIARAEAALRGNGNPPPEFVFEATHVLVTVRGRA